MSYPFEGTVPVLRQKSVELQPVGYMPVSGDEQSGSSKDDVGASKVSSPWMGQQGVPEDTPTAPDLRWFSFFGATQYIVSHLLMHMVVALTVALVLTLITTVLVINFGGFAALAAVMVTALRTQVWSFCSSVLPTLLCAFGVPLLEKLGMDVRSVLLPLRKLYIACCLCFRFDDGPLIFLPRTFLAVDAILTGTLGVALGLVDGVIRVLLGAMWGILRCVVLSEPVVPTAFRALDRPYMAYGGMMRSAHADILPGAAVGGREEAPRIPQVESVFL